MEKALRTRKSRNQTETLELKGEYIVHQSRMAEDMPP